MHTHESTCIVTNCMAKQQFGGLCNFHLNHGMAAVDRRANHVAQSQTTVAANQKSVISAAKITNIPPESLGAMPASLQKAVDSIDNRETAGRRNSDPKMSFKYPQYYKAIPEGVTEMDIYMLCRVFNVEDSSGCVHHALKKLLLPGVRTGGKSRRDDIKEARDTLSRWLEIHS